MRYKKVFDRRTLLRGAGAVAIALPFLDEMRASSVFAAEPEPPVRGMTLFFGLGIIPPHQAEGFAGPLAPLQPFQHKLSLFLGNVDMTAEAQGGAHPNGGTVVFTGAGGGDRDNARGASIEQVVKSVAYPGGTPTAFGTVAAATYFRRNGLFKTVRCWDQAGAPAAMPYERPEQLFDALFGTPVGGMTGEPDPDQERQSRLERSVLDATIEQYSYYTSEASNLSVNSRARIADHLERLRELERRIFPGPGAGNNPGVSCSQPARPVNPPLEYEVDRGLDGSATEANASDFQAAFQLNSELFVMGLRCDLFRFGNLQFESPGGHVRLSGTYETPEYTYTFDPSRSNHQNWHESRDDDIRWNSHYLMHNMAYVLGLLDDGAYLDENGQTLLDNLMLVLGTEQGDGRGHDVNGVFHAVGSGNGRFRVGEQFTQPTTGVNLYNTITQAYGVQGIMGDASVFTGPFGALLA
jgi:hypothetical protein